MNGSTCRQCLLAVLIAGVIAIFSDGIFPLSLAQGIPAAANSTPSPTPTSLPVVTLEGDAIALPLPSVQSLIGPNDKLTVDVLNEQDESYVERAADLLAEISSLCFVGNVNGEIPIFQTCRATKSAQIATWKSVMDGLAALAKRGTKFASATSAISDWRLLVERSGEKIYLLRDGTFLVPATFTEIARLRLDGGVPQGNAFRVKFNPFCLVTGVASGKEVSTLCAKSIPIPPIAACSQGSRTTAMMRPQDTNFR